MDITQNTSVYERIKGAKDLPSPAGVALSVMRAVQSEETSASDLARLVEMDPAITVRLLRAANSPVAGVSREIASVQDAATLLGFDTVKSIALWFSLLSDYQDGPCSDFDYDGFWSESLARAVTMRQLTGHLKAMPVDEAFTYGLLSLIGRLALVQVFPDTYRDVLRVVGCAGRSKLAEVEEEVFQIGPELLSALMMQDWGMPHLYAALQAGDRPESDELDLQVPLVYPMLRLSASLAEILVGSNTSRDQLEALTHGASRLGLEHDALGKLFEDVADEWHATGQDLGVRTRRVGSLSEIDAAASDRDTDEG